uniref:protein GLUTAMINE DUMPER 2-like n=1 Tax=Erigeron canadensis TaxID=72917 RepID=UPI001CB91CA2|nr:protein GLUTAMINE DUMPER 2-like [Erigeron canadensis]
MESTELSSSMESSASSSSMESPASSSSLWQWGSPSTYMFGGIGAMLLLIALALLMLTCSYLRHRYEDTSDRKAVKHVCKDSDEANASPKIVVIMAGEEIPTYLAAPAHVTSSRNRQIPNQAL